MLRELLQSESEKAYTFQTMLLKDDATRQVEVHEAEEVDFCKIQEHLRHGGSVFITSKSSQKLPMPTLTSRRATRKRKAARTITALFFDHV